MKQILPFFALVIGIAFAYIADADVITFAPPTERENNEALSIDEINEFRVYDSTGNLVTSLPNTATSVDIPRQASPVDYYLTTYAFTDDGDNSNDESVPSQLVTVKKFTSKPKPPTVIQ